MADMKGKKALLGVPAVRQILGRLSKSEAEERQLAEKIEKSCRKFDRKGKGSLTADDYFNVVKLQNGIDVSKDELKRIVEPLSKDKEGRIKIDDFMHKDIHSQAAFKVLPWQRNFWLSFFFFFIDLFFQAIDRNKDGFITKGELKLAKKDVGMDKIGECIKSNDLDGDGKLNMHEFEHPKQTKKKWKLLIYLCVNFLLVSI